MTTEEATRLVEFIFDIAQARKMGIMSVEEETTWIASLPHRFRDTVLCIACFTSFADEAGIEWAADIEFYPCSLIQHHRQVDLPAGVEDLIVFDPIKKETT